MSSFISVIHSSHLSQNTLINWILYFYLFNNCFIMTKLNIFSVFSFVIDFLFSVCARNKTIQRCFSYNWRNIKNHAISSGLDRILIIVRDIFMYIQIWDYKNLYLFDLYLNLASFLQNTVKIFYHYIFGKDSFSSKAIFYIVLSLLSMLLTKKISEIDAFFTHQSNAITRWTEKRKKS